MKEKKTVFKLFFVWDFECEKGWIRPLPAESGSRKKEYQLTAEGVQILKHELARLQQLVANGESILKEEAL